MTINTLDELIAKYKPELDKALGTTEWKLQCTTPAGRGGYSNYKEALPFGCFLLTSVDVKNGEGPYSASSFTIKGLPGCCGCAISHQAMVYHSFRQRGIGTILQRFRMDLAKYNGYTVLMCTDVDTNEPQNKILNKNGWKKVHQFQNKRTGNFVNFHIVELNPEESIKQLT